MEPNLSFHYLANNNKDRQVDEADISGEDQNIVNKRNLMVIIIFF